MLVTFLLLSDCDDDPLLLRPAEKLLLMILAGAIERLLLAMDLSV